ncbi:MAG: hypothetical protein ACPIOQ_30105, partial [Promethearchaeia archaeon]
MQHDARVGSIKRYQAASSVFSSEYVSSSLEPAHSEIAQLQRVAHFELHFPLQLSTLRAGYQRFRGSLLGAPKIRGLLICKA